MSYLKNLLHFDIDDTPSIQNSAKMHQDDFPLDFHAFLTPSVEENPDNLSFSNQSVKKAGRRLRKKEGDLKQATFIIQTFRAAHETPLNAIADFITRCCMDLNIQVKPVKRLKRLETIIDKLQRKTLNGEQMNQTCVSNMNDIGGCRAIFPDIASLKRVQQRLVQTLENEPQITLKDIDDYIQNKKQNDCGYRSLHIIYQYAHIAGKKFKIEAQLRTKLQHLWATTVEIVDILEGTKIKTHSHSHDTEKSDKQVLWEQLLSIMSDFIADAENIITLTTAQKQCYAGKLRELDQKLKAVNRLKSFKMVSERIDAKSEGTRHVLLVVNGNSQQVKLQEIYEDHAQAIGAYNHIEKVVANIDGLNALLVSTKNLDELADAYPNYIGDCASFIEILCDAMKEYPNENTTLS